MSRFSDYLQAISRVNLLGNGLEIQWLFHCGMLFSSRDKWWGDFKFRQSVHEGIDITYFRTHSDELKWFDDSIKVPAMNDGVILNICDDFLAQTLVVKHRELSSSNKQILFVYAHIVPESHLRKGHAIQTQEVIARVSDTHKNPQLPPHLHFSCFEVGHEVPSNRLNWDLFSKSASINMIHPLFL